MIMIKSAVALLLLTIATQLCAQTIYISQNVGVDHAPPYSWYDKTQNERIGLIPYLQERLFREVGMELKRIPFDLSDDQQRHSLYRKLALGDIDVIGSTARLPRVLKVAKLVDEPLFEEVIRIYVRAEAGFEYEGWRSLKEKKGVTVSTQSGRTFAFYPELADYAERHFALDNIGSHDQAIQFLLEGKVDYWVASEAVASSIVKMSGFSDNIRAIETPLAVLPLYMAVSNQSPYSAMTQQLAKRISQLRESGEYDQIKRRYLQRFLSYYDTGLRK